MAGKKKTVYKAKRISKKRQSALAFMLTMIGRDVIRGRVPIQAPESHSGKTILASIDGA